VTRTSLQGNKRLHYTVTVTILDRISLALKIYSGADWAEDDCKSVSGYLRVLAGGSIFWSSKKQTCVATSSGEAELIALSRATEQALYMHHFQPLHLCWRATGWHLGSEISPPFHCFHLSNKPEHRPRCSSLCCLRHAPNFSELLQQSVGWP